MVVPRGWREADAVAAVGDFLCDAPSRRAACRGLIAEMQSLSPYARRCAADLARRVSAREPGVLREYADGLIDLVAKLPPDGWQARGYVTLAAALNAATHAQRKRLVVQVRAMTKDERIGLRAIALEAFTILAVAEPKLRNEAMSLLELSRLDGSVAIRMRARRMLLQLLEYDSKSRR